jgi:hypothetical protein
VVLKLEPGLSFVLTGYFGELGGLTLIVDSTFRIRFQEVLTSLFRFKSFGKVGGSHFQDAGGNVLVRGTRKIAMNAQKWLRNAQSKNCSQRASKFALVVR